MLVGVLDDDAEAGVADGVFGGSEDPDAWVVHLDDGVDALAGTEEEGLDRGGCRNRAAVEGDHLKRVAWQREASVLDGRGVEDAQQDALALFDPDGLAGS